MPARKIAFNALVAAAYVAIALAVPTYHICTALYALAAFDPALIPGLVLGNALAGVHHRPLDLIEGAAFGWVAAWLCARLRPAWAPLVIAVVPTVLVSLWLTFVIRLPALLPGVVVGQISAAVLAWGVVLPVGRRLWSGKKQAAAEQTAVEQTAVEQAAAEQAAVEQAR